MTYHENFKHADDLVAHLNGVVPSIADPLLQAKYIGFVSVAAVTVYELAVKEIFITFAAKKHMVLRNFAEAYFDRINGRIRIQEIRKEYIPKFGAKYEKKFQQKIEKRAQEFLRVERRDIRSSYGNLVTWRNDFAHEGRLNATATYTEVIQAYEDGKEVIHCLADAMNR
ncbi:MAG: hypothetical protein K9J74_08255 [Sulfuritalea sp.]|nr:hypothetical protein [Sulfuritalea sp.]